MTITAAQTQPAQTQACASTSPDDVSWRALRADLWAARRDGRHLGTVERGRRWLASDADSEPIGAFRTFQEAQDAVTAPAASRNPTGARRPVPALVAELLVAGVSVAAFATGMAWVWAILLP